MSEIVIGKYKSFTIDPLLFLIEDKKDLVIAELGVLYGDTCLTILNKCSVKKYYAIDLWRDYDGYDDSTWCIPKILRLAGEKILNEFKKRTKEFPQVEIIREWTEVAYKYIKDGELDFCFIDANHDYEYVYKDIELYLPKIKKGGIICGDDWRSIKSVGNALTDFFINTDYKVNYLYNSWWVRK